MKNLNNRKVAIVGDGMVGSSIAYTLLLKSNIQDIVIIDVNKDKAEGDALDMNHAMSMLAPKDIKAGSYEDIEDAHIIV
ncbi:MAG: L-lactate dehydrogenase, partial [Bacilli bacterium]|nr:L-lactate dehydrogenase [Bacilli bacterium]